jgi:hypothetical protein
MSEQINPSNIIAAVISQWETAFIEQQTLAYSS